MAESESTMAGVSSDHKKCPSCGAEMQFDPDAGALCCPYCAHKEEIQADEEPIPRHDYAYEGETAEAWGTGTMTIHCENCGASMTVDRHIKAQTCAFCGSPVAVKDDGGAQLLPDAVLPFRTSKKEAVDSFTKWISSRFFSPGKLKKLAHMEKMDGVYIPYFIFDAKSSSEYTAEAGTHYYVTEMVTVERDGKQVEEEQRVQKTSWEPVSGTHTDAFANQPIRASKRMDDSALALTFDPSAMKAFRKEYLLGFQAEQYSISKDDCWIMARRIFEERIAKAITSDIHADEVRGLSFSTTYTKRTFRYALFPAWISSYSFKNKVYKFMVNGYSGETEGKAPLSALRIIMSILLVVCVPVGLFFLNHILSVVWFVAAALVLAVLSAPKKK